MCKVYESIIITPNLTTVPYMVGLLCHNQRWHNQSRLTPDAVSDNQYAYFIVTFEADKHAH